MLIQWAFEIIVPWLIAAVVVMQVVLPLLRGTPLFPVFRRRSVHQQVLSAAEEVEQLEEQVRAARLHREAEKLRAQLIKEEALSETERSTIIGDRGIRLRKDTKVHDVERLEAELIAAKARVERAKGE